MDRGQRSGHRRRLDGRVERGRVVLVGDTGVVIVGVLHVRDAVAVAVLDGRVDVLRRCGGHVRIRRLGVEFVGDAVIIVVGILDRWQELEMGVVRAGGGRPGMNGAATQRREGEE